MAIIVKKFVIIFFNFFLLINKFNKNYFSINYCKE